MRNLAVSMMLALGLVAGACQPAPGPSVVRPTIDDDGDDAGPAAPTRTTTALTVRNQSSLSIWYLYVSDSTLSSWGPDQLGSQVVSPGESFRVTGIPCGRSYDFKVEGPDHAVLATRFGTYLSCETDFTWTLTN